jgi:hypothetical protein
MKRSLSILSASLVLAAGWALAQNAAEPKPTDPKPAEEKPAPEVKPFNASEQIPVDVAVDFPADI